MSRPGVRALVLAAAWLPAARADFQLLVVEGNQEQAVSAVYSFGTLATGDAAHVQFRLRNAAAIPAVLSYLEVRGVGFQPRNPLALPVTLGPQAAVDFTVTFSAPDAGAYSAALVSEGISVILLATVQAAPPLPVPRIAVVLPQTGSAQQGSVSVSFDAPAQRAGTGTLTLDFQPGPPGAIDMAVAFASGGRTADFRFAPGDTQVAPGALSFQTGTTTGILAFTATIGNASDRAVITIAPAPVGIRAAAGTRSNATVEIRVTGFDNTRTAGRLAFTFFDPSGTPLTPAPLQADATQAFAQLYETSDAGGAFLLRAVFPLNGDSARIAAFEASISNSEGTAVTPRGRF